MKNLIKHPRLWNIWTAVKDWAERHHVGPIAHFAIRVRK